MNETRRLGHGFGEERPLIGGVNLLLRAQCLSAGFRVGWLALRVWPQVLLVAVSWGFTPRRLHLRRVVPLASSWGSRNLWWSWFSDCLGKTAARWSKEVLLLASKLGFGLSSFHNVGSRWNYRIARPTGVRSLDPRSTCLLPPLKLSLLWKFCNAGSLHGFNSVAVLLLQRNESRRRISHFSLLQVKAQEGGNLGLSGVQLHHEWVKDILEVGLILRFELQHDPLEDFVVNWPLLCLFHHFSKVSSDFIKPWFDFSCVILGALVEQLHSLSVKQLLQARQRVILSISNLCLCHFLTW